MILLTGLTFGQTASADDRGNPGVRKALGITQIAGDNKRFVSYLRADGTPVVFDTERRRTRIIRDAKGCLPEAVGGLRVLLSCPEAKVTKRDSGYRGRTASVFGGRAVALPKSRLIDSVTKIGKFWVEFSYRCHSSCYKGPQVNYLNWRSGKRRHFTYEPSDGRNLSSRDLTARPTIPFQPKLPAEREPALYGTSHCWNKDVVVTDGTGGLRLWWSRYSWVQLGRGGFVSFACRPHDSIRIGPGRVAWSRGPTVNAYNYRTGKRFKHRFPGNVARVTPVRRGVVVAHKVGKRGKSPLFRLKLIRLG